MRALIIEHDHLSPPGPLEESLKSHGFEIKEIMVVPEHLFKTPNISYQFPSLAELATFDLILCLGAPWGAWDEEGIGNWLLPELKFLTAAMKLNIPILGICFGGQLLARILGGEISQNQRAEIGWTQLDSDHPHLISAGPWFQFHFDQWSLPPQAVEIARNSFGSQAFLSGKNLALQFHPDITVASLLGWLENGGRGKIAENGQDPQAIESMTAAEAGASRERTFMLMENYLREIAQLI